MKTYRIAIVTGVPAPYREPVFAELASRAGVEMKVFYCTPGEAGVAWETNEANPRAFPHEFLFNWTPPQRANLPVIGYANTGVGGRLRAFAPDFVLVYGYAQLAHWLTFNYCHRYGVPFALRSDTNIHRDTGTSWRNELRRRMLRKLVRRTSAILTIGTANRQYWERYGATPEQFFYAPYAVDNEAVARLAAEGRQASPPQAGVTRFAFVGRLVELKGVDLLLPAFNRLVEQHAVTLTLIGDGPQRDCLQALQTPAARTVTRWLGKQTNEETFWHLGQADVLVSASRLDHWGLVVNEAMAAGLPVIAPAHIGAAIDLVNTGHTGIRLEALDTPRLEAAMTQLAADPAARMAMGESAHRHIANWSFTKTVDGFLEAVESCVVERKRQVLKKA